MSVEKIIKTAVEVGIYLYVEDGKLKFKVKKGRFDATLKAQIKEHKNEIISYLEKAKNDSGFTRKKLPELTAMHQGARVPLSFQQQRLWFVDQLEGGSPEYNFLAAFKLTGKLDVAVFKQALTAIIERHEVLRTLYISEGDQVYQDVVESYELPLIEYDFSEVKPSTRLQQVKSIAAADAAKAFDLSVDLMVRAKLIKFSAQEHVVLFNIHHIATDSWSMGIFVREFSILYKAFANNQYNPLPPLEVQYSDFAYWQKNWLNGELLNKQISYWEKQLKGIPQLHNIPLDKPRPAKQSFKGNVFSDQIDKSLTEQLKDLSYSSDVTLFILLQSAFAILLGRYSGEKDIVIGSPVAGRSHTKVEPLVGFFVNNIVLRSDLSQNIPFNEYLQQSKQVALDAYNHQQVPFEMLVEKLTPERSLAYNPIVQLCFNMQKSNSNTLDMPNLILEKIEFDEKRTVYEIDVHLVETEQGIALNWYYNTDLFSDETIKNLAGHYQTLLHNLCIDSTTPIHDIELISEEQTDYQINGLQNTTQPFDENICFHQIISDQANKTPDSIAVKSATQSLTYAELESRSNQLARLLIAKGITSNSKVGVASEEGLVVILGILAVAKAGASYVPIDVNYPDFRVAHILNDADISLVLTCYEVASKLEFSGKSMLLLDAELLNQFLHGISDQPLQPSEINYNSANNAYVIYTSGSTGVPKGVMVHHKGLMNYLNHVQKDYVHNKIVGSIVSSSIAFDATITSMIAPLCMGLHVDFIANDYRLLEHLTQRLSDQDNSYLFKLTPSHLDGVLKLGAMVVNGRSNHVIVIGGEQLALSAVAPFISHYLTASRFINEYGPTETVVGCSTYEVTQRDIADNRHTVPIGKAIANTHLYVFDHNRKLLPVGAIGELYIGGIGVAQGYLGRKEMTEERFNYHQWSDGSLERLYRTGDLVRLLHGGDLQFIGRIDEQVKLRGFRIEVGEIESILNAFDSIQQAIVAVKQCSEVGAILVAYILPSTLFESRDEELLELQKRRMFESCITALKAALPHYMVPNAFVILDEVPLTTNDKVDKNALPMPDKRDFQRGGYLAPRDEVEELLCEIWQDVLNIEEVGVLDDFFLLGGHSLLGTQMISQVRERLGIETTVRLLFERPTLEGFASGIQELLEEIVIPDLEKVDRSQTIPLSFSQQRLWFIEQLTGSSLQYNLPTVLRLKGSLNLIAMNQALTAIVDRHEVLRTHFIVTDGNVCQVIKDEFELFIPLTDVSSMGSLEQEKHVEEMALENAQTPFNLSQDLMLRARLLKLSEQEHIVCICMHHIASDGWSISLMIKEFTTLYEAFSKGGANPLLPLKYQYADYAFWQRNWLQGDTLDSQLGYWKMQLSGMPELHQFPLDKSRLNQQSHIGASYNQQINEQLAKKVQLLSQNNDVTLFMFLQSAFASLLSGYSNQQDIVMGTAIAGRIHRDVEPLIGFFVNDLVLRTKLSGDSTFAQLLQQNKQMLLDAYSHQHVPFEMLVEALCPERNLRHNPIVQIKFDMNNTEQSKLDLADIEIESVKQSSNYSRYDLYLLINETANSLSLNWRYSTDLFFPETIARLSDNFIQLLTNLVDNIDKPLSQISMLYHEEKQLLLRDFNNSEIEYATDMCLHQLFEQQVTKTPDNIAVVYGRDSITYDALNREANKVARFLIAQGVKPDTLVGICLERSIEMYIGLFGIMKAGGAYVPLDPGYPQARLEYMIEDSGVEIILTESGLYSTLGMDEKNLLLLDEEIRQVMMSSFNDSNISEHEVKVKPDNLIYAIYTSGSTGQPKGVLVEHKTAVNFMFYSAETFMHSHLEGALVSAPLAFDGTVCTLYSPLLLGKYVELLPASDTAIDILADYIFDHEKSLLFKVTPSHLEALFAHDRDKESLKARHVFVVAGEMLTEKTLSVWRDIKLPASTFYNEYGPTECTVGTTVFRCIKGQPVNTVSGGVPIGSPLANATLYVLDEQQKLLPMGCVGELYIGGKQIARGYHNKPELTAERFLPDPFNNTGDCRMYRTGDLVRWLSDGNIEFLGRVDNQVKLRGFRLDLTEIEKQLNSLDGIRESVVVLREDEGLEKRLVAYIVSNEQLEQENEEFLAAQKLRIVSNYINQLKSRLPHYMVPFVFVFMDQFPLTPNGKIDRKGMPMPGDGDLQKQEYVPPSNEIETVLCDIWQEVLGVNQISIHDDFFVLGGHSLLATRVMALLRSKLDITVSVAAIFEHQTIESLAKALPEYTRAKVMPPIEAVDYSIPLPLSFSQQRIWVLEQLSEGSTQYNMPGAFELRGKLNVDAIKLAFDALIERHQILRTMFVVHQSDVHQIVLNSFDLPVTVIDLSSEQNALEIARGIAVEDARTVFDLAHELPIRVTLVKISEEHLVMIYNIHHIASDGLSNEIWRNEFFALYDANCKGQDANLAPLKVQYADYACWQREYMQGEILSTQLSFWKQELFGAPVLHGIPPDFERKYKPSSQGGLISHELEKPIIDKLNYICQEQGITPFMLMHAALTATMAKHGSYDDLVVGAPVAGRIHEDLSGMIGCFINTLVLRTKFDNTMSFEGYLKHIKQVNIRALAHQEIPFEYLVEHLQVPRTPEYSPIFQIMLSMATKESNAIKCKELECIPLMDNAYVAKFELMLDVKFDDEHVSLHWVYDKALFKHETIARLNNFFVRVLEAMTQDLRCSFASVPLLSVSEQKDLLAKTIDSSKEYPKHETLDSLFAAQVKRTPNAVALVSGEHRLSYAELDQQANRLAGYLIARGVGKNKLVAIDMGRSIDLVVVLLGVLKAGGAYVPLDPDYPQSRIEQIISDSKVDLLITESAYEVNLKNLVANVVVYDRLMPELAEFGEFTPDIANDNDHLAYVIYTSGSTGKPKGVQIEHCNASALVHWSFNAFSDEEMCSVLFSTSICFDLSIFELFATLSRGGKVVVVDNIMNLLEEDILEPVSLINTVPSALKALVLADAIPKSVITINSAGEFMEQGLVSQLYAKGVSKVNDLYGPSEDTTYTTWATRSQGGRTTIGRAIDNTRLYVFNRYQQLVAQGVEGELYVAGDGVSRGYLGQEELTASSFLEIEVADKVERLYKTGDLVKWNEFAELEYVGRIDSQVKVRGHRIEVAEIEHFIRRLPECFDVVVDTYTVVEGDTRLAAYIVLVEGVRQEGKEVVSKFKRLLQESLPHYMVPSQYVIMDKIPLTPNGKVDRRNLPEIVPQAESCVYHAPQGDIEKSLVFIWQSLLGIPEEEISTSANFFELGGHSLLIVHMAFAIERHFSVRMSASTIFQEATIKELGSFIELAIMRHFDRPVVQETIEEVEW